MKLKVKTDELVTSTIMIENKKMNRYYSFIFQNGRMIKVETNVTYHKRIKDWEFYAEAIKEMLKTAKKKKYIVEDEADNIPF